MTGNLWKALRRVCLWLVPVVAMVLVASKTCAARNPNFTNKCFQLGLNVRCVISHPKIVNVYWDTSAAQWDLDTAATDSTETQFNIDRFMHGVIASDYLKGLVEYQVGSASFLGSITATECAAPPGTANLDDMTHLVSCVKTNHPELISDDTVLNLFLPPQTAPAWVGGNHAHFGTCSNYAAFHILFAESGIVTTIIPTRSQCNKLFGDLVTSLTHEMVEAITDPDPILETGWIDPRLSHIVENGSLPTEIADVCDTKSPALLNLGVEVSASPFLGGMVDGYWSNSLNRCIFGFTGSQSPTILSGFAPQIPPGTPVPPGAPPPGVSVCGSGEKMRITVRGSNFGNAPWDIPDGASRDTSYFNLHDQTANWNAGHAGDLIKLNFTSWTDSQIQITGVDFGASGFSVTPGDTLTITVANVASGQSATSSAGMVPLPSALAGLRGNFDPSGNPLRLTPATAGASGFIFGTVTDANSCGVEGMFVQLAASAGSIDPQVQTGADGTFTAHYTAPSIAGVVFVNAEVAFTPASLATSPIDISVVLTLPVSPTIHSVTANHAGAAGGLNVAIMGAGFADGRTQAVFGGVAGTAPQVMDSTHLQVTVPASPLPDDVELSPNRTGDVDVVVKVDDFPSPVPATLTYMVPRAPLLRFSNATCGRADLTVSAWNADGTPEMVVQPTPGVLLGPAKIQLAAAGATFKSGNSVGHGGIETTSGFNGSPMIEIDADDPQSEALLVTALNESDPQHLSQSRRVSFLSRSQCAQFAQFAGKNNFKMPLGLGEKLRLDITNCIACSNPNDNPVAWNATQAGKPAQFSASLNSSRAKDIAQRLNVAVLRPAEATALLAQARTVQQSKASAAPISAFIGSVAVLTSNGDDASAILKGGAMRISFDYDVSKTGAQGKPGIYRLTDQAGTRVWSKVGISAEKLTPGTISANINAPGIYTVIVMRPAR